MGKSKLENNKKWCVEVHNLTAEQTIEVMNTLLELGYAQSFAVEEKILNMCEERW